MNLYLGDLIAPQRSSSHHFLIYMLPALPTLYMNIVYCTEFICRYLWCTFRFLSIPLINACCCVAGPAKCVFSTTIFESIYDRYESALITLIDFISMFSRGKGRPVCDRLMSLTLLKYVSNI